MNEQNPGKFQFKLPGLLSNTLLDNVFVFELHIQRVTAFRGFWDLKKPHYAQFQTDLHSYLQIPYTIFLPAALENEIETCSGFYH